MPPGLRPRMGMTPPFITPEQGELMAEGLPGPPPPDLPPAPELRPGRPKMGQPPIPPTPDPTMITSRPDPPPDPARLRWQDDEELFRSIQKQRPEMRPPGLLNKIGAAAMGGLGGYLMSSPRPGAQAAGQRAMGIIPDILHPGRKQQMQTWGQEMDLAKTRVDRSREAAKLSEDLDKSEASQDYMKAQAKYQEELPELRRQQTNVSREAKMVTITPEIAKELGLGDDRLGEEISVGQYTAEKKAKSWEKKNAEDRAKWEAEIKARKAELDEKNKVLKELEDKRGTNREKVAKTQAAARIQAAGISANKPRPTKLVPRGVKLGDKTYHAYMDDDGNITATDFEVGDTRANDDPVLSLLLNQEKKPTEVTPKPEIKPTATPKPAAKANTKPSEDKRIRIKVKANGRTATILEKEFDPAKYEKLKDK